ncbi:hypothetical protein GCM10012279_06060 [Micromonospora yangpuensis]|nr:hypothetical protein GCM10012279_06060 [Micromonospora yangpuensis]
MGRVWKARDEVLHRDVAIKELVPPPSLTDEERREMRERSLREARAIARLNNINVVRIFDVLRTDGDPWIVMEYVASKSLQDTLAEDGPVTPARAVEIGLGVLGALKAAHKAGVMHRDVKPGNVLLGTDGRVVLTDFGLATIPGDPNVTRTGMVLGSPAYIAPERARDGTAGPEADLWSLGATLYAAVEGKSPYARPSAIATLAALATEPMPPAKNAGPLKAVLNGLLRKDPAQRIDAEVAERLLRRARGKRTRTIALLDGVRRPGPNGPREPRPLVVPAPRPEPPSASTPPTKQPPATTQPPVARPTSPAPRSTTGAVAGAAAGDATARVPAPTGPTDAVDATAKMPPGGAGDATAKMPPGGAADDKTTALTNGDTDRTTAAAPTTGDDSAAAASGRKTTGAAGTAGGKAAGGAVAGAGTAGGSDAAGGSEAVGDTTAGAEAGAVDPAGGAATTKLPSPDAAGKTGATNSIGAAGAAGAAADVAATAKVDLPTTGGASTDGTGSGSPGGSAGPSAKRAPVGSAQTNPTSVLPPATSSSGRAPVRPGVAAEPTDKRRNLLIGVVAVVLLIAVAVAVPLLNSGDTESPPNEQAAGTNAVPTAASEPAAPAPTSAAPSPSASPSVSPSPSAPSPTPSAPAQPGLPAGWKLHRDPAGFSVPLPDGWRRSSPGRNTVVFTEPGGVGELLIQWTSSPQEDAVADWRAQEPNRKNFVRNYQYIDIKRCDYYITCADWDWRETRDDTRIRVRNRGFATASNRGYAIRFEVADRDWSAQLANFDLITKGFVPDRKD